MEDIREYFRQDALAKHLGIDLADVSPGSAVAKMAVRDIHRNSHGTVHGGAIFTLADFAFAAASNSHGTVAVALNAGINFTRPASAGVLTATASEVSCGRTVATYSVTVTDDAGKTVALFQGMVFRKGEPVAKKE